MSSFNFLYQVKIHRSFVGQGYRRGGSYGLWNHSRVPSSNSSFAQFHSKRTRGSQLDTSNHPRTRETRGLFNTSVDEVAKNSALALRSLIVGSTSTPASQKTTASTSPSLLANLKSQLLQPKTANKVIALLKDLPSSDDPSHADKPGAKGPIHAVCLAYTDVEAAADHFSKLVSPPSGPGKAASGLPSFPVDKVAAVLSKMRIIDLVKSAQSGGGPGTLSGALPKVEAVIKGVESVSPELKALGYATGKAINPDHSGVYPPTDRMSILTYWWGLEIVLPSSSLTYLGNAQSITDAVTNFLSALAIVESGVAETLPFIRAIATYIDVEFDAIKAQDQGKGVVCAATWIMPVDLVPRAWDFQPKPPTPDAKGPDASTKPPSA